MRLSLLLLLFTVAACREGHRVTPAFYWWKTTYNPSSSEKGTASALAARKCYVRLFDIDLGAAGVPVPRAPLRFATPVPAGVEAVPVVYLTTAAIASLSDTLRAVPALARNLCAFTDTLCRRAGFIPRELQIDCDWTRRSRPQYFALLRALRKESFLRGKSLSVTIRLHQIKYTGSAGIPPADRGMLMCYNMGNTPKPGPHNSILDADAAEAYLANIGRYPLPLDLALPLFRWTLLFRDHHFVGILRDVTPQALSGAGFLQKADALRYHCSADAVLAGYDLRRGDELRAEAADAEAIRRVARYAARRIRNRDMTVALYHLDSLTCAQYSTDELESFFRVCR